MSDYQKPPAGTISWFDLTVENAAEIRDFYANVIGWKWTPHPMGEYDDYDIRLPGSGETVTGICHAREGNANVPPVSMMYVTVEDITASVTSCIALGGRVIAGPRPIGNMQFCIIQDPAGAMLALIG